MSQYSSRGLDPLKYTRVFLVLAEEMHFGRAARRLRMAQPSLSQQIAKLEAALGFKLFERGARGVFFSRAGEKYFLGMRQAMAIAAHSIDTAENYADKTQPTIRVGFVSAAMFRALPPVIAGFRENFPTVDVALFPRTTSMQIAELHAGMIDVACVRGPVTDSDLAASTITTERLLVAMPGNHRLARRRCVRLRDFRGERLITFPRSLAPSLANSVDRALESSACIPSDTFQADDWPSIVSLVASGSGFSIVPESVSALRIKGAAYRTLSGCDIRADLSVVCRRDRPSAHVDWLVSALSQCSGQRTGSR